MSLAMTGTLIFGGDVAPIRSRHIGLLGEVGDVLRTAELAVANLEVALTDQGTRVSGKPIAHHGHPDAIAALIDGGFDAMNMANNHVLDYGEAALVDCLGRVERAGLPVFGAGRTAADARKAVVLERGGLRIGLLGYSSTLPQGFAAGETTPGVNPLHVRTAYRPSRNPDEYPGSPALVETWPEAGDLERMTRAIVELATRVDLVLVYQHWGCSMTAEVLAFQRAIGHAAIDAGAAGVFGGHQHVVSAIEFHKGRPIVHGMGNLVFDIFAPFLTEITHRTFLFKAQMTKRGLEDCEILPCRAGVTGLYDAPVLLAPDTGTGGEIVASIRDQSAPFGGHVEVTEGRARVRAAT